MGQKRNWRMYAVEFISIFIAVISAFALNNWNDNRRDEQAATKILTEIANGLELDLEDVRMNIGGHQEGIDACRYWRRILNNEPVNLDSLGQYYLGLTRNFFTVQNNSGYETLKSRGLELIKDDSLRFDIISLYEYDYTSLRKMEEEYFEMQFQENYFRDFNRVLAPYFDFDDRGNIQSINPPLAISGEDQKILLAYLWKIEINRRFALYNYADKEKKIQAVVRKIEAEIANGS